MTAAAWMYRSVIGRRGFGSLKQPHRLDRSKT
jgi:hypothetical protein